MSTRSWVTKRARQAWTAERLLTVFRAIIESSIISWFGVLSYGMIWQLRDTAEHYIYRQSIAAILPAIFVRHTFLFTSCYSNSNQGISQTLIIARVGLSRFASAQAAMASIGALIPASETQTSRQKLHIRIQSFGSDAEPLIPLQPLVSKFSP
jgi:hypothetical protein